MKTPVKLGLFALSLLVIFAGAWGIGRVAGPHPSAADQMPAGSHGQGHETPAAQTKTPGGLAMAQDGYRLEVLTRQLSTVEAQPFRFRVIGPDGKPLTAYTKAHEKDLHLILVRRDLSGFQHVHPVLDADGVWSVPLQAAAPGPYRVFADFLPAARKTGLVLGTDVTAPGDYQPQHLAAEVNATTTGEYTVSLAGELVPGTQSKLTLTVTKAGLPVTDLQPYLGAFGHLVALRDGDLAYLHVHPEKTTTAGPHIIFYAEVPSEGSYGLFLDFQHNGTVRTAQFTATAGHVAAQATPSPASSHGH